METGKQYTHKCIKSTCSNTYFDNDPEPYYCEECKLLNKKIVSTINNKLKSIVSKKKVMSELQEYNSLPKGKFGFPIYRG